MSSQCGIFRHPLVNGVYVTDEKHISFIMKSHIDFRPDDKICYVCKRTMEYAYAKKLMKAKQLLKNKKNSVSTVSSLSTDSTNRTTKNLTLHLSLSSFSSNSTEQIEGPAEINEADNVNFENTSVAKKTQRLRTASPPPSKRPRIETNGTTELNTTSHQSVVSPLIPSDNEILHASFAQQPVVSLKSFIDNAENVSENLNVRLSQQPTTSAAARAAILKLQRDLRQYTKPSQVSGEDAKKSRLPLVRLQRIPATNDTVSPRPQTPSSRTCHITGSDDDDEARSLNFYDTTVRLPHVQPIPKRRTFQHKDNRVMDMYAKGLIGG